MDEFSIEKCLQYYQNDNSGCDYHQRVLDSSDIAHDRLLFKPFDKYYLLQEGPMREYINHVFSFRTSLLQDWSIEHHKPKFKAFKML